MTSRRSRVLTAAAIFLASAAAFAHHSPSAFDLSRQVTIEGTITKVAWMNPHVYFTISTTGPDGAPMEQEIHAGSASALTGMGVPREAFAIGRRVSVRAFPARRASARIVLGFEMIADSNEHYTIEFAGGTRTTVTPPTVPADGLAGRWLPQLATAGRYAADVRGRLTAAALASAADVEGYRAAMTRCETPAAPQIMMIPMVRDLALTDSTLRISVDWMSAERTIHIGQADHPANLTPSAQGHSIGRWENDVLVIDTVGFLPHRSGVSTGVTSSAQKHLVERLSLTEDKLRLKYELTLTDPENLTEPMHFTQLWDHRPDLAPSGEPCDPEVAGRFLQIE